MSKLNAKSLVTVHSVREANTRVMTRTPSTGQFVTISSRTVAPERGNVAVAGAWAMRASTANKKG